jgi:hypothetical protein
VPAPLDPELRELLAAVRADPPPRATTRNRHYFTSNENQHHLWREVVTDLGGIQIGVGTDQNYLIAGWSRPDVLVLFDYDQWVVDLNWIYGLVFEQTESPEAFVDAWAYRNRSTVRGWIEARFAEPRARLAKLRVFEKARGEVHGRLERLQRRHAKLGIPSFLDDGAQFAYVRALWTTGRALSVRGNLVEATTLGDLAEFARRAKLPIRLLYLSNAEDYFDYRTGSFRANVLALPFDERSLVLHTKPRDGDAYRYLAQGALNYRAWLESERVASFCELFAYARASEPDIEKDRYALTAEPASAPAARSRCAQE